MPVHLRKRAFPYILPKITHLCALGKLEEAIDVVETFHNNNNGDIPISKTMIQCLLHASSEKKDVAIGRRIQLLITKPRLYSSSFVLMDQLIRMFTLCGNLEYANQAFGQVLNPSIYTWQAIISAHVFLSKSSTAFELFCSMLEQGHVANGYVFSCILKACHKFEEVALFHHAIVIISLESDVRVGASLMHMYVRCRSIEDACCIFNTKQYIKSIVSWGIIISGCIDHGLIFEALWLFERMMNKEGIQPDQGTFLCILRACGQIGDIACGRLIHVMIVEFMVRFETAIMNCLIDLYVKCGIINDAESIFQGLKHKDIVSWGTMIDGYTLHGNKHAAFFLFEEMQLQRMEPNKVIMLNVLKACVAGCGRTNVAEVRSIHYQVIKCGFEADQAVGNCLLDMYAKCGSLTEALEVFHALHNRDIISWSTMMRAYSTQCGFSSQIFDLFVKMVTAGIEPDAVTFSCVLKGCALANALNQGRLLHEIIIKASFDLSTVVQNALLDMYLKCKSFEEAHRIFDMQTNHDSISWATMIGGYADVDGHSAHALDVFSTMGTVMLPGHVSFLSVLKACNTLDSTRQINLIHDQIVRVELEGNISIANSLINTYAKLGALPEARKVFDQVSDHSVVSWGAMITGYLNHGDDFATLQFFEEFEEKRGEIEPNHVIFSGVLKACGNIGAVDRGKVIHHDIIKWGVLVSQGDVGIESSLLEMYVKCGTVEEAYKVFTQLSVQTEATWATILTAYASNGGKDSRRVQHLLHEMQTQGVNPNGAIFTGILIACSHRGQVKEGCMYFTAMTDKYGILPSHEHYTCMIDLLGRVGCLDEAKHFLHSAPMLSDFSGWVALLNACMLYSNMDLAKQCFHEVHRLYPELKREPCTVHDESYKMWTWSSFLQPSFGVNVVHGHTTSTDFDPLVHTHYFSNTFDMKILVEEENTHFEGDKRSSNIKETIGLSKKHVM